MEAHNFIFPKLLTTRRVDAIHGYRQGTSSVNRIDGGKGGGPRQTRSAPGYRNKKGDQQDRPQCTHCQGQHSSDNCYLKYPEKCDWLQKVLQQFPQRKKQRLDRWKQRKCIHCGKDRHPKGTRCSQDQRGHPGEKTRGVVQILGARDVDATSVVRRDTYKRIAPLRRSRTLQARIRLGGVGASAKGVGEYPWRPRPKAKSRAVARLSRVVSSVGHGCGG